MTLVLVQQMPTYSKSISCPGSGTREVVSTVCASGNGQQNQQDRLRSEWKSSHSPQAKRRTPSRRNLDMVPKPSKTTVRCGFERGFRARTNNPCAKIGRAHV